MPKVAVGSIPEKISYVYSDQHEVSVGCEWDINWHDVEDAPKTVKKQVTPAFPIDSKDEKGKSRAIAWATSGWDVTTRQHVTKKHSIKEVNNTPITNVKVLSLEQRGQGGRAYKALIDNFYVDLREDVLVDTLLQSGVEVGGILKGEYIWAKMGSQMKLVRIGSELHRLIVEFDSKKDIKPVGKKDLEIGGIYQDRKKNRAIFIGYVNTTLFTSINKKNLTYYEKRNRKATFDFSIKQIKKSLLFYSLYDYTPLEDSLKKMKHSDNTYSYDITKTHTYIEKVGQAVIPNGIIQFLRDKAVKDAKNKVLEYTGHNAPKVGYQKIDDSYLEEHIEYNSRHLNLCPYGETVEPFDVKKLLLFS